jgi:hypothetical protein
MTPPYGRGVIYEPHDPRTERYSADVLIGASPTSGPMADHVHAPDGWPDQGSSNSCTGQAIRQAVWIRQCMMGIAPRDRIAPSDRDIYYRARASRHGIDSHGRPRCGDIGANPVAAWETQRAPSRGGAGLGIVAYDDLPFDLWHTDEPYDASVFSRSVRRTWLEYRWILDDVHRCEQLDALLRGGHPVCAAITCDASLLTWRPSSGPWSYRGPSLGGHYVAIVHVDTDGDYVAVGTWGASYGESGFHRIARSEIASSRTSYLATPVIYPERMHHDEHTNSDRDDRYLVRTGAASAGIAARVRRCVRPGSRAIMRLVDRSCDVRVLL